MISYPKFPYLKSFALDSISFILTISSSSSSIRDLIFSFAESTMDASWEKVQDSSLNKIRIKVRNWTGNMNTQQAKSNIQNIQIVIAK